MTFRSEGVVLEVREDEFDVRIVELDGHEVDLEATFAVEELLPDEVALLRVGSVFSWTGRALVEFIRFRRLPADDLTDAEAEAEQIRRDLRLT